MCIFFKATVDVSEYISEKVFILNFVMSLCACVCVLQDHTELSLLE